MEIIGYLASLVIGISLGLIGGGGSVLTVPVLVYLFGVEPVMATTCSLFVVGATSFTGVLPRYRHKEVHLPVALAFGTASLLAVYTTRAFLLPAIPHTVAYIGSFVITKPLLMMLLFSLLMIAASFSMIRNSNMPEPSSNAGTRPGYFYLFLAGLAEGTLTGLVGAGGGFLIIPVLVLIGKLPMRVAIGTSLLIIAVKSMVGFWADKAHTAVNYSLLLWITVLAVAGIFIGSAFSQKIAPAPLKRGFGWFILIMGIYIIAREIASY